MFIDALTDNLCASPAPLIVNINPEAMRTIDAGLLAHRAIGYRSRVGAAGIVGHHHTAIKQRLMLWRTLNRQVDVVDRKAPQTQCQRQG